MKINTDNKKIEEFLSRGTKIVINRKDLEKKLKSGKKLRVKHGVDPTTKDLHLGYSAVYLKLKELQEMGHQIVFLIGDFTGRFGDPTEKSEARELRTKKEVKDIAKDYLKQVGKLLDLKKTEIRYNSEWYDKMSAEDLLKVMSSFTVSQMLERDMFQDRIKKNKEIRLHEPIYPVLQGYDSVMLKSDLTVCGVDQIFNELKGRDLQSEAGQTPQDIVGMEMLVGLDGKMKMSQSLGNYIGFNDSPKDQYGKIMSIPDNLIFSYFNLVTQVPVSEIQKMEKSKSNPRDLKARLAKEVVTIYHSEKDALKAEEEFKRVFTENKKPTEMPKVKIKEKELSILDLLFRVKVVPSKAEAKRMVLQKAVEINDEKKTDWKETIKITKGMVIRVGRKFVKIN